MPNRKKDDYYSLAMSRLKLVEEYKAENKALRQGIIENDKGGVSLVPNDIWDKLKSENKRLREALENVIMQTKLLMPDTPSRQIILSAALQEEQDDE